MRTQPISRAELALAMNLWMENYTRNPEEFALQWKTVLEFLNDQEENREPSYGKDCSDYIFSLLEE